MRRDTIFAEGMGAGAAAILFALAVLVFFLRRGGHPLLERLARGPATLPADYADVCRAAGL